MRWVRLLWPVALAMLQALFALGTNVYAATWAAQTPEYQIAAMGAVALGAVNVFAVVYGRYQLQRAKLETVARDALQVAMIKLMAATKVEASEFGLHAYTVRIRWYDWRWRRVQERVGRLRLMERKPRNRVVWTRGKGVVGRCWEREVHPIGIHLHATHAMFIGCSEGLWGSAGDEMKMGLSFDEWGQTQVYAFIKAHPMQVFGERLGGRPKYVGCVSIDTMNKDIAKQLDTPEVEAILRDASSVIAGAMVTE